MRGITVAGPPKRDELLLQRLQRAEALLDQRDVTIEEPVDLSAGLIGFRREVEQLPHVRERNVE